MKKIFLFLALATGVASCSKSGDKPGPTPPATPLPKITFSGDNNAPFAGTVNVSWTITNAQSATASHGTTSSFSGTAKLVWATAPITITVNASGAGGTTQATFEVAVTPITEPMNKIAGTSQQGKDYEVTSAEVFTKADLSDRGPAGLFNVLKLNNYRYRANGTVDMYEGTVKDTLKGTFSIFIEGSTTFLISSASGNKKIPLISHTDTEFVTREEPVFNPDGSLNKYGLIIKYRKK